MTYEIIVGRSAKTRKILGDNATVLLGKQYISMGQVTALANKVYLDVNESHAIFVVGKRGSGKSYSLGVMAEGIYQLPKDIRQKLSCILLDTMGVYWTMKYPNHKDETLLNEWGLESEEMDVKIYTPFGFVESYREQGIPSDMPFAIHPMELTATDWALSFELSLNDSMGVILEKVIGDFKDANLTYTIDDIVKAIQKIDVDNNIKNALVNRFTNASHWGVFSTQATPIETLAKAGQVTVLDLSPYATIENGWAIKSLVIGILASKLFIARMKSRKEEELKKIEEATKYFTEASDEFKDPLVWLIIDEAHEFLPNDKITTATDALVTILREGRQPGISLVLASQQPGKIHTDVMTQSDIIIAHRLTAKIDVDALGLVAQSYLREGIVKELNALPSEAGAALILDDANERIFPVRMKPRSSWHGGETPQILKEKI